MVDARLELGPGLAVSHVSTRFPGGTAAAGQHRRRGPSDDAGSAPPPTPAAPTLLSPAQDANPAQPVAFDWTDVSAATSYRIQIDDSSTFSSPLIVNQVVSASQFTAPILASRRHWWRVRAINSAGVEGPFSSVRRFTPR